MKRATILAILALVGCTANTPAPAPVVTVYTTCVTWTYDPTVGPVNACEDITWPTLAACQIEGAIYLTPAADPNGIISAFNCVASTV